MTRGMAARRGPPGFSTLWRATLENNGAAYQRVLTGLDGYCREQRLALETAVDVDAAASAYCLHLGKGEAGTLLAALWIALLNYMHQGPQGVPCRDAPSAAQQRI